MIKICEGKKRFVIICRSMQNFLELQCVVDDLVNFLDLLIFINVSLKYII